MEVISKHEFYKLVITTPQILIGRNIIYERRTAEIVNISLGGSAICVRMSQKDTDESKAIRESDEE